jgi:hypothetical protein
MKAQDVYKEPIILEFPNATVRVYRPELSAEERERRMKRIHDSAAELLKNVKGVSNG